MGGWSSGGVSAAILSATMLCVAPAHAATPRGMDRPIGDVQADLGKRLGCEQWQGGEAVTVCILKQTRGELSLSRTATGALETVEMTALIATSPRRPADEKLSRDTVKMVVRQLLPAWQQGPEWLEKALLDAVHVKARKVEKVGSVTVLVQWLQPADLADTFATVVVTKKASLEEWEWGDGD